MLRLSVAQSPAHLDTPADRLDWLRDVLPGVTESGSDLLLLPELFAHGYNIGDRIHDRAEPTDGPTATAMAHLARDSGIALHYGFAERSDTTIYNSAACIAPDGSRLCLQRKLAIPPGREARYFTPGQGFTLFPYRGIRIATLICYDAEFPETVRHVAAKGAQLILVPTALGADWSWVARSMIPTRAYENGVYLAYANSAGTEHGMAFLGASVIANPDGTEAARAGQHPELLHALLDPARVTAAQTRLPYLVDRQALRFD
jgi:5-aminopentanamidase